MASFFKKKVDDECASTADAAEPIYSIIRNGCNLASFELIDVQFVLIRRLRQVLLLLGTSLVYPMWISVVEGLSPSGSKRWNTNVHRQLNCGDLSMF